MTKTEAQDKTVKIDTINIRGIVLDDLGKPVPLLELLSKNRKLLYPNHEFPTFTNIEGKFVIYGALVNDTITTNFFGNSIRIVNNGSRYLEINLPPASQKNPLRYSTLISAQRRFKRKPTPTLKVLSTDSIFDFYGWRIQRFARFRDGNENFNAFIKKQIAYPEKAIANNIEGEVEIGFTVDRDGALKDFKVLRGIGYDCDEQVIKAIKKSPSWIPAFINGKTLATQSSITINFKLTDK